MNRSDEPSSQRFPSSYHHIDQSPSVQNSLNHLLPVLICHVNVINLQQPIVHPGNTEEVNDDAFNKQMCNGFSWGTRTLTVHLRHFLCPPL